MATTITAAGDIVVGTGSGTYDNLPIGTTAQVLTADTTVSPYKVKWATPASSTPAFVGCALTKSVAQSIANASEVTILFDTEDYDTDGFHSTSSNTSRITIPTGKGGKYLVTMQAMVNSVGYPTQGGFNKNGSNLITTYTAAVAGSGQPSRPCIQISQQFSLAAGDYIELFVYQATGAAADVTGNNYTPNATRFAVAYLGA
jgi:hypothetical protein